MSRGAEGAPVLPLGARVAGRYVVVGLLGQGGMGQVFEVEHETIGRRFALKILNLDPCTDEALRRFQREARALGRVTSPRVAQVSDFGYEPGIGPYYVMELLDGETLGDRLEREIRIPVGRAVPLGVELAEALHEVHLASVIHRDLKPSNVGLCRTGAVRVKLLDFGLAAAADHGFLDRITRSQEVVGSLPYMAPERFNNAPPSPAIDLYALGVVLYETLTGRLPYEGASVAGVINAHLNARPPSFSEVAPGVSIPPAVEAVVARLLEKDPRDRFVSALAAAQALQAAVLDPASPTVVETAEEALAPTFFALEPEVGARTIEEPSPFSTGQALDPSLPVSGVGATLPAMDGPPSGPMLTVPSTPLPVGFVGSGQVPPTLFTDSVAGRHSGVAGRDWTTGQPVPPVTVAPPAGRGGFAPKGLLLVVAVAAALFAASLGGVAVALLARNGAATPATPMSAPAVPQGPTLPAAGRELVEPLPAPSPASPPAPSSASPAPPPAPSPASPPAPPAETRDAGVIGAPRPPSSALPRSAMPGKTAVRPPGGRDRPPPSIPWQPTPLPPPPRPPPPQPPAPPPRRPAAGSWDGGVIIE